MGELKKSWGKGVWENKALNQTGFEVSMGFESFLKGKKLYEKSMKDLQTLIKPFLSSRKINSVLEIGPGLDAINAKFFLDAGYDLDIVDCAPTTLREAKSRLNDSVNAFEQDMVDLSIPKKYDLIFCYNTFMHCPSHLPLVALTNWKKHLNKGGIIIMDYPLKKKPTSKFHLRQAIYFLGHEIKTKLTKKDFFVNVAANYYDEFEDILDRTGLKIIKRLNHIFIIGSK